jgi:nucleotide-binding universal stress UspA family protein
MYHVIVVGTDGSETAAVAVRHATGLAKLYGASLHVVHAFQVVSATSLAVSGTMPTWVDDLDGVNEEITTTAALVCQRAAEQGRGEGVEVETHALAGDPADLLLSVAEDVAADLIVVGNRGMTGVRRFVLGSVPNKVSHHCPCSLLIVDTSPT